MKLDQCLLTWFGLNVFKDFFLIIYEYVSVFMFF